MRSLKSLLGTIKHVVTAPLDDLIKVSALLESPSADDSNSDRSSTLEATAHKSTLLGEAVPDGVLQPNGAPGITDPHGDDQPKRLVLEQTTLHTTSVSIVDSPAPTTQLASGQAESTPSDPVSEDSRADHSSGTTLISTTNASSPEISRDGYNGPGSNALATAKSNAQKAYETISMYGGSSAIFGDVHLSDQQGERQIVRFEDPLGRFHRVPFEQCRSWAQMRALIHYAFRHRVELMPYIEKDEYHLIGPDREIIMPAYWQHAIVPGMLIRMVWLAPDPEIQQVLATTDSTWLHQHQTGSLPELAKPHILTSDPTNFTTESMAKDTELASLQMESFAAFAHENYSTAIARLDQIIFITPSDHLSYLLRSRAYLAINKPDEALQSIARAVELKADSAAVWIQKGTIEHALQRHQDAKEAFTHALSLEPASLRAQKGLELVAQDLQRLMVMESTVASTDWMTDVDDHSNIIMSSDLDHSFEQVRVLGKGSYGTVNCVRERSTGNYYAVKVIPTRVSGVDAELTEQHIRNEAEIMTKLRHIHIASLNIVFKGKDHWSMFMLPVADLDLRSFLDGCAENGYPRDSLRMIDPWFGCLVSALSYAHSEKVKHEDIKPSNILIKGKRVYLADFGTAKDFSDLEMSISNAFMEQGTPVYWPPEARPWGRAADVFALGCVFCEMFTIRQKRSLQDFRRYRYDPSKDFGYAYRNSLPKVKKWLKDLTKDARRDSVATTIVEQTMNMMSEEPYDRPEARRLVKTLKSEEELFCDNCL